MAQVRDILTRRQRRIHDGLPRAERNPLAIEPKGAFIRHDTALLLLELN
jgi:hypothetical protein